MKSEPPRQARWQQGQELVLYLIAGGLTTLVNTLTFWALNVLLGEDLWVISLGAAILVSILFAYVVNRRFVFRSTQPVWPEIVHFILSRLLVSALFEYGAYALLFLVLGLTAEIWTGLPWAKLLGQILVVIGNYLVGKFAVFRERNESS